jgi:hypothetical protein
MDGTEMIVSIVAIGCGTGMFVTLMNTIRAAATRSNNREQKALAEEVLALRADVQTLRAQHNDLLLNVDTTLQRVERRLALGDARTLSATPPESTETRAVLTR